MGRGAGSNADRPDIRQGRGIVLKPIINVLILTARQWMVSVSRGYASIALRMMAHISQSFSMS